MICPKCNKSYNDDDMYCIDCGVKLIEKEVTKTKPMERFSNKVKTSKPQDNGINDVLGVNSSLETKLDILIIQNKEMIRQNNRIIELLEKNSDTSV